MAPDWPYVPEKSLGVPSFGVNLCGGPKVTIAKFKGVNNFVGIKRNAAGLAPPGDWSADDDNSGKLMDGPMRASAPLLPFTWANALSNRHHPAARAAFCRRRAA